MLGLKSMKKLLYGLLIVGMAQTVSLQCTETQADTASKTLDDAIKNNTVHLLNCYHLEELLSKLSQDKEIYYISNIIACCLESDKIHELKHLFYLIKILPESMQEVYSSKILDRYLKTNNIHKLYPSELILYLPETKKPMYASKILDYYFLKIDKIHEFRDLSYLIETLPETERSLYSSKILDHYLGTDTIYMFDENNLLYLVNVHAEKNEQSTSL